MTANAPKFRKKNRTLATFVEPDTKHREACDDTKWTTTFQRVTSKGEYNVEAMTSRRTLSTVTMVMQGQAIQNNILAKNVESLTKQAEV